MATWLRLFFAFCGVLVLTACASTGNKAERPLDPILDDVASLIFAFDLPRGLGPTLNSVFTFEVAKSGTAVQLTPVPAEVESLPAGLPPPAADRVYYFFIFTPEDRQIIRDAQITAQFAEAGSDDVTIRFIPKLCSAGLTDGGASVSVLAVLPGRNPQYFIRAIKLGELLKQTGSMQIPACT